MSERLRRRLLDRIGQDGPITFAAFMEAALYDEEEGFYARPPVGEAGHFVTSPHISPAFGALLARQVAQCWELLGRPGRLDVVEPGAGDGTLARQILEAVGAAPELGSAIRYVGIERTEGARRALKEAGIEAAADLPSGVTGVVLANELLDNLPFHRLRERDGRAIEVLVGVEGDELVEVEGDPTPEALAVLDRKLRPGEERPVSPAALRLIDGVGRSLRRGYAFFFDYAFGPDEAPGPVHGYRLHEVVPDVLEDPGSRDITAAVDLSALARTAGAAGLQVFGPVPQREALLALGYRMWSAGVRARQADAEAAGDWRLSTRLYGERSRASLLIDPAKLGGLQLLVLATDGLPPPAAALGDPELGC